MVGYEVLKDIFVAAAIPSAEETAAELVSKFHTLDGVFSADNAQLVSMVGERVAMLVKIAAAISSRRVTDGFEFGKRYNETELKELLVALYRGCSVETIYLLSFDKGGRFIACDYICEGTVNAATLVPRQILERALKNRAAGVVFAHNHPAGIPTPSTEDFGFTSTVRAMLENVDVNLLAHYTVAGSSCIIVK